MAICKDIFDTQDPKRRSGVGVILPPDWTILDLTTPYFDQRVGKYFITVPTSHDVPAKDELQQILQAAKHPGCEGLLTVYGKVVSEVNIQNLVRIAETPDWFVPERPNPKCGPEGQVVPIFGTKVLVSVEASAIDKLPFAPPPAGFVQLPHAAHEINLVSSELKAKIKGASNRIAQYATDSEHVHGRININLKKESSRLENFVSVLENLLIANGFHLRSEQDDLIIIGIDDNNKVLYVLFDNNTHFVRMASGFDNFAKTKPASNDRTINYLRHLDELNDMNSGRHENVPLVDFLKNFTSRTPEIKLGGLEANFSKTFGGKTSIGDVIKTANGKSVKSEEDLEAEDVLIASPRFKAAIALENNSRIDFVGDAVLAVPNFDKLLGKVNSLEDVYQEVLNKVSIQSIIAMALKCFPPPDPCVLARAFLRSLKPNELVSTLADKAGINFLTIPELEPAFRAGIKQCFDSMSADAQVNFLGIVSVKAGANVNNVSQLTGIPLQTIVDAFEGRNFLNQLIEENFFIDILDAGVNAFCAKVVVRTGDGNEFSFDFNLDIDINLPEIPKFEIPTITLDDLLPTADIMASISAQIEVAITDALVAALVDMIKNIIKGILENCGDISDKNFGALNLNDLLAKSVKLNVNTEAFLNVKAKLLGGLSVSLGSIEAFANNFSKLMDDVSALLTPSEISNLLNGNVSEEVTLIIDCLVATKYSALKPMLDNPAKVEDTFQSLGELVDKQLLLDQIAQRNEVFGTVKEFCEPVDNDGRKKLLENKGLTPSQVDDQIAMANKRRSDRLNNLLDLANKKDILDGAVPPVFCKGTDNKLKGMIPRDHPSFKHMLNKTVDVMYENTHISFNNEITAFPTALKETGAIKIPREIPRKIHIKNDELGIDTDAPNPEFTRLVAQGVPVEDSTDLDGDPVTVWEDLSFSNGFVAKGLKNNLATIETDSRLFSVDPSTGLAIFNIPNNISPALLGTPAQAPATTLLPDLQAGSNVTNDTPAQNLAAITNQIATLPAIEHKIEYAPSTTPQIDRDEYTFIIEERNTNDGSITEIYRNSKSSPLPTNIANFARTKNLSIAPNTSLPQSYFSSLAAKIWKEGAPIYRNGSEVAKPDYAKGVGAPNNLAIIDGTLRDKFKGQIYANLFSDIFSRLAKQTSTSKMFDSRILSLVKFTPPKQDNGCQPHLLDLEAIKQKMKDDFNNSECAEDISPVVDGLGKPNLNSLEQAGVSGAVMTFIRLYTIELILKSIFVYSEFKVSELSEIEEGVLAYYATAVKKGIDSLGALTKEPEFITQFNEQVLKTYNTRVEKKELSGQKTDVLDVAMSALIQEQVLSIIQRITALIGSQGDIDLKKIVVEEWLPLFDVADGNIRLAADPGTGAFTNLKKSVGVSPDRKDYPILFNLERGSLALERYIRIDDKPPAGFSVIQLNRRGDGLFGVANLNDFDSFIQGTVKQLETTNLHKKLVFSDEFQGWSYGLRMVYIPPTHDTDFEVNEPNVVVASGGALPDRLTNGIRTTDAATKFSNASKLNKAFRVFEGTNVKIDGGFIDINLPQTRREIDVVPLFSVEIPESNLRGFTSDDSVAARWNSHASELQRLLMNSQEFSFLFDFCFPLHRMMSFLIIYNSVYLSNVKKLIPLFNGTKTALKSVFQALLNSGNYKYDDPYISHLGGNSGGATVANNNENTEPEVPGLSLAAIAARTPFLILKGLVELTDINIGNARKIVDTAKEHDKNIPIALASLAQLPMNIIPPPPFGPGIGAPITPLGFLYLALDIDGIFDSAKGKDTKRDEVNQDFKLDLNIDIPNTPGFCPDKSEET